MKHTFSSLLTIILVLATLITHSQDKPIELKEIDKENLEMDYYAKDSSSNALILCDYGNSYFRFSQHEGFKLVFKRHVRKKIFNKNGFNEADISIPLHKTGNNKEHLSSIKAYTYNLENDNIKRTRLRKRNIYYEEKKDHLEYAKFTFPKVKEGSIIEVKYTINSDFLYTLHDWQFQHDIPVKWSGYIVEIPEYFHYNQHAYGYEPYKINKSHIEQDNISITTKTRTDGTGLGSVTRTNFNTRNIHFKKTVYKWVAQDLPAFKEEPYMTCPGNFMNRIEFELARVKLPQSPPENYSQTWESIRDELYQEGNFGRQLKRSNNFLNDPADEIRNKTENPRERMASVFSFIKKRMKWNGEKRTVTEKTLRNAYKDKNGNSAEINLLLTVMLQKAGIKADPVILSTRDHGMIHPSHPSLTQTNYVISRARIQGKDYLMDATEPFSRINMLPVRCLNGRGQLMAEDKTKSIKLYTQTPYKKENFAMVEIQKDTIEASIRSIRRKYAAYRQRNKYRNYAKPQEYITQLEQNNPIKIHDFSINHIKSVQQPVVENFDSVSVTNHTYAGNRIYFNPIIYERRKENPFKLENRKFPVNYAHPYQITYNYQIKIPQNYTVESLPKPQMISLPKNNAQFVYSAKKAGNKILVTNVFSINKVIFTENEYDELKNFYDQVIDKQAEQIVLKKGNTEI